MSDIRPIETRYKGYRFRSRLEARWAVFFDNYGLRYEYELEGYRIGSVCYLPDFFLPDLGVFVEIKPTKALSLEDITKLFAFALDGDKKTLLIIGTPGNHTIFLLDRRHIVTLEEYGELTVETVAEVIADLEEGASVTIAPLPLTNREFSLVYASLPPYHDYKLVESVTKAREARFEFGENGTTKA